MTIQQRTSLNLLSNLAAEMKRFGFHLLRNLWRNWTVTAWLLGISGALWIGWLAGNRIKGRYVHAQVIKRSRRVDPLCNICRTISLEQMGVSDPEGKMQTHQPSYFALKKSVAEGCKLCGFIWAALGQSTTYEGDRGTEALALVSERYPGREISLLAWPTVAPANFLDRVLIVTSGEVPDADTDDGTDDGPADPSMHPDHQFALSGVLDIFAYPGTGTTLLLLQG